ncbi:MAG TPA: hypothetical protein VFV95_10525 [Vicinamibacterales bacterium]|nr:hypothetical protein [Vicinamibacterales bacterium]
MCARLAEAGFAEALWAQRLDVWTSDRATQEKIGNRLGWLTAIDAVTPQLARLRAVADSIRDSSLTDFVLLGMGGSSLAPEVLRQILGVAPGYPRFRMLDSVDPDAVRDALSHAATSVFIEASKSGSTIEPTVMAAEARARVIASGEPNWGSRFIAITDQGTALHQRAIENRYRDVFVNPSDIGGRFSALSLFGMVPGGFMGADVSGILARARDMETACRGTRVSENPGLALGAFMAAGAADGRDKLTLLLHPRLASFGLWVEQLIAESTGKQGKGIVPIAGEAFDQSPGSDRAVVAVSLAGEPPVPSLEAVRASATTPLVEIDVPDVIAIGAEFLRWEVATATAGQLMGINPFDEPNVSEAKLATSELLTTYETTGDLPGDAPDDHFEGAALTVSTAARESLGGHAARQFLQLVRSGDYFALLAYLPPDREPFHTALQQIRSSVGAALGCATMFGYGPRYLHSTGQLHKGGANNGVFVIITAPPDSDLPIPDRPYSFGVLEMAQAIGDFRSLERNGRRALHVHLPTRDAGMLRRIFEELLSHSS